MHWLLVPIVRWLSASCLLAPLPCASAAAAQWLPKLQQLGGRPCAESAGWLLGGCVEFSSSSSSSTAACAAASDCQIPAQHKLLELPVSQLSWCTRPTLTLGRNLRNPALLQRRMLLLLQGESLALLRHVVKLEKLVSAAARDQRRYSWQRRKQQPADDAESQAGKAGSEQAEGALVC